MKRTFSEAVNDRESSSYSELSENSRDDSTCTSSSKRNLIFVEESTSLPPVGTHHGGSFDVYMSHKVAKLRNVHRGDDIEKQSRLFDGCVVYVNGVTNPPVEEIRRLVTIHGGECVNYRVSEVTHFVCDNFTDAQLKVELARQRLNTVRSKVHNVTASWITASIRDGRRLNETEFLPNGLKLRTGPNIAQMLQKSAVELQKKPQENEIITINEADSEQQSPITLEDSPAMYNDNDLTFSQQQFIRAIPRDLREEALQQIKGSVLFPPGESSSSSNFLEAHVQTKEELYQAKRRIMVDEGVQLQLQELVTVIFGPKHNVFQPCAGRRLRQQVRLILQSYEALLDENIMDVDETTVEEREFDTQIGKLQQLLLCLSYWMIERDLLEQVGIPSNVLFLKFEMSDYLDTNFREGFA